MLKTELKIASFLILILGWTMSPLAFAVPSGQAPIEICANNLAGTLLEDPFSLGEMRAARQVAETIQPFLEDWSFAAENIKPEKIAATFARLRADHFELDGPAFRNLYLIIQRLLLASRGTEGPLRPLAEVLQRSEGESRRLVNFVSQIDALAYSGQIDPAAPRFLKSAQTVRDLIKYDLGESLPATWVNFIERGLGPVVRQRLRYVRLRLNQERTQLTLLSPVGVYKLSLDAETEERPLLAEPLVSVTNAWGRTNDQVVHMVASLSPRDAGLESFLRTMIRPDAFLHPHQGLPALKLYPRPTVPSDMQEGEVIQPMLELDAELVANHSGVGPIQIGMQGFVGMGKTVCAVSYLSRVPRPDSLARPRYLVVLEGSLVLEQTVPIFKRDLNLDPKKMLMMFGDEGFVEYGEGTQKYKVRRGHKMSPPTDWDAIFISRSTLEARWDTIKVAIERENTKPANQRRDFRIFMDEGAHVGAQGGDFATIFKRFDQFLTARDRILIASATLTHPDYNIIRDRLGGAVVAAGLAPDHLAQLRRGENVIDHSRTQYLHGIIDGWLSPFDKNSFAVRDQTASNSDIQERLKRGQLTDRQLYEYAAELIHSTRHPNGGFDRGLIFEPLKGRAREGARLLQQLLGTEADPDEDSRRTVWEATSDLSSDENARRVRWFRSLDEFRGTRFRHHYLETVNKFLEGNDIPEVNLLVNFRNFESEAAIMQAVGRAARVYAFKVDSRVIDVSGRIVAWLEKAGDLWQKVNARQTPMIGDWDRTPRPPAEPRVRLAPSAAKSSLDLTTHQLDLTPTLKRERARVESWRTVSREDLRTAMGENGALKLLRQTPDGESGPNLVSMKEWFGTLFNRYPAVVQAGWRAEWKQIGLRDERINPRALTRHQREQAIRAFRLLTRMFNGMTDRQRMGLARIEVTDAFLARTFARVRYVNSAEPTLVPDQAFEADRSPLDFKVSSPAHREELAEGFKEDMLLSGADALLINDIEKAAKDSSALAALRLTVRIFSARPPLERRFGAFARRALALAEGPKDLYTRELNATFLLAQVLNVVIRDTDLDAIRPFNINGLFHLRNDEDVLVDELNSSLDTYDLVTTLDLAEHRLGGPEALPPPRVLKSVPEVKVESPLKISTPSVEMIPDSAVQSFRENAGARRLFKELFTVDGPRALLSRFITFNSKRIPSSIFESFKTARLPTASDPDLWTNAETDLVLKVWRALARATEQMNETERAGFAPVPPEMAFTAVGHVRMFYIFDSSMMGINIETEGYRDTTFTPLGQNASRRLGRLKAQLQRLPHREGAFDVWLDYGFNEPVTDHEAYRFFANVISSQPRSKKLVMRMLGLESSVFAFLPTRLEKKFPTFSLTLFVNRLIREAGLKIAPVNMSQFEPGAPEESIDRPSLEWVLSVLVAVEFPNQAEADEIRRIRDVVERPGGPLDTISKKVKGNEIPLRNLYRLTMDSPANAQLQKILNGSLFNKVVKGPSAHDTKIFMAAVSALASFTNNLSPIDRFGFPEVHDLQRFTIAGDALFGAVFNPINTMLNIPPGSATPARESLTFLTGSLEERRDVAEQVRGGVLLPGLNAELIHRIAEVSTEDNVDESRLLRTAVDLLLSLQAASVIHNTPRDHLKGYFESQRLSSKSADLINVSATLHLGYAFNRMIRNLQLTLIRPWNLEGAMIGSGNPRDVRRSKGVETRPSWPDFLRHLDVIEKAFVRREAALRR